MRITLTKAALLVAALLLAGAAATYVASRDAALAGAERFAAAEPQVVATAGAPNKASLSQVRYYSGVPGAEEGYREYQFAVIGPRGAAHVLVRARGENQWRYELVSVK
jgi:hypothetical protein